MSPRLATVSMSCAACGLGWQGGGGCSPVVRCSPLVSPDAGLLLACAGRVPRPTFASIETQAMMLTTHLVFTSPDGRCVIFPPSRQLWLCGEPRSLVHYTGRRSSDWRAETLRELPIATLECG